MPSLEFWHMVSTSSGSAFGGNSDTTFCVEILVNNKEALHFFSFNQFQPFWSSRWPCIPTDIVGVFELAPPSSDSRLFSLLLSLTCGRFWFESLRASRILDCIRRSFWGQERSNSIQILTKICGLRCAIPRPGGREFTQPSLHLLDVHAFKRNANMNSMFLLQLCEIMHKFKWRARRRRPHLPLLLLHLLPVFKLLQLFLPVLVALRLFKVRKDNVPDEIAFERMNGNSSQTFKTNAHSYRIRVQCAVIECVMNY